MIIAVETIQKAIHFVPNYDVEYTICEWKGEGICDRVHVKLPVVDTHMDFPVLLWYNYNWTQPCGLLNWPDKPHFQEFIDFLFYVCHVIRVHTVAPLLDWFGVCHQIDLMLRVPRN
mgnify:CR=1 FL=1